MPFVIIFVIVGVIFGHLQAKKRREAMVALATRLGLRFDPGKSRDIARHFTFLDKLRQGSNRYAFNTLSGHYHDQDITAFDYHYETHSTNYVIATYNALVALRNHIRDAWANIDTKLKRRSRATPLMRKRSSSASPN